MPKKKRPKEETRGRNPLPAEERRGKVFQIRISPPEDAAFNAAAKVAGVKVAEWGRGALRQAAGMESDSLATPGK